MNPHNNELFKLVEMWTSHLGYYDGRIDLKITDLSSFATANCHLLAHAPLWGSKPDEEEPVPASKVRENLSKYLKWTRVRRHNMHIAYHPESSQLCLFFIVKIRPILLPFNIMTVPLAFIVKAVETENGLRIDQIDERAAENPEAARAVLLEKCDWPSSTNFEPVSAFGAAS